MPEFSSQVAIGLSSGVKARSKHFNKRPSRGTNAVERVPSCARTAKSGRELFRHRKNVHDNYARTHEEESHGTSHDISTNNLHGRPKINNRNDKPIKHSGTAEWPSSHAIPCTDAHEFQ